MTKTYAVTFQIKLGEQLKQAKKHIDVIRDRLNDYPDVNLLLNDKQFGDRRVLNALLYILEDFNTFPPMRTYYTLLDFPRPQILYTGAIAELLRSLAITDVRNFYPFQAGDIQLNPSKANEYLQLSEQYRQMYIAERERFKRMLAVEEGYGGVWRW
jgi:hypothetical protein